MSPAINELTPPADAPPTTITSASMPCFLNSPFSSAIHTAALIGVNELKPMRRRSAAIAELKVEPNAISNAKPGATRNFKRLSNIGRDLLPNQVSNMSHKAQAYHSWGNASSLARWWINRVRSLAKFDPD